MSLQRQAVSPPIAPAQSEDTLAALMAIVVGSNRAQAEAAFALIYDASAAAVVSLARRYVRDSHTALDVAAEVYFQAWRDAASFDAARGPVIAWLLVITRSRALDWLRRADHQALPLDEAALEAASAHGADGAGAAMDAIGVADPLDLLTQTQAHAALREALAQLKPRARQWIALAFMRGLTHAEIAALAGEPLGTVKTVIRRALQEMQQYLMAQGSLGADSPFLKERL